MQTARLYQDLFRISFAVARFISIVSAFGDMKGRVGRPVSGFGGT
jgi:hypothetical protein